MLVTRVIGTKMRRRPNTSATMPSTRGWLTSERMATTRSRTLPTWSPCGSKIGSPTSRAAYTRDGLVLTCANATRRGCHDGRMTRPTRVVLHVGLPKTGTTYLQAVLAHHRDALREAGVLYPFVKPQAMFLGAVEVRGSHEKFGLSRPRTSPAPGRRWPTGCAPTTARR